MVGCVQRRCWLGGPSGLALVALLIIVVVVTFVGFVAPLVSLAALVHLASGKSWALSLALAALPALAVGALLVQFFGLLRELLTYFRKVMSNENGVADRLQFDSAKHLPYIAGFLTVVFGIMYSIAEYLRTAALSKVGVSLIGAAAAFMFAVRVVGTRRTGGDDKDKTGTAP